MASGRTLTSNGCCVEGPSPGAWHGLAGMAEGFRAWFSASEDVHVYADEFRELDDERVAVLVHGTGRGKASGLEYSPEMTRTAHLFHVQGRQGRQVRSSTWTATAPSPTSGWRTDESQGVWTIFLLCERVVVGAGDDELKRRFWG